MKYPIDLLLMAKCHHKQASQVKTKREKKERGKQDESK